MHPNGLEAGIQKAPGTGMKQTAAPVDHFNWDMWIGFDHCQAASTWFECGQAFGTFKPQENAPDLLMPIFSTRLPAAHNATVLSVGQFRKRYLVALSLIALLTIGSQWVVQLLILDQ